MAKKFGKCNIKQQKRNTQAIFQDLDYVFEVSEHCSEKLREKLEDMNFLSTITNVLHRE